MLNYDNNNWQLLRGKCMIVIKLIYLIIFLFKYHQDYILNSIYEYFILLKLKVEIEFFYNLLFFKRKFIIINF